MNIKPVKNNRKRYRDLGILRLFISKPNINELGYLIVTQISKSLSQLSVWSFPRFHQHPAQFQRVTVLVRSSSDWCNKLSICRELHLIYRKIIAGVNTYQTQQLTQLSKPRPWVHSIPTNINTWWYIISAHKTHRSLTHPLGTSG